MDGCLAAKNGRLISATLRGVEAHVQHLLHGRRRGYPHKMHGAMLNICPPPALFSVTMDGGPSADTAS